MRLCADDGEPAHLCATGATLAQLTQHIGNYAPARADLHRMFNPEMPCCVPTSIASRGPTTDPANSRS